MNTIPAGSNGQNLSVSDLYTILETKFENKAVGFAFVISYKEKFATGSSGGFCRLQHDSPARTMTVFEKYNCASVSKPISAAALMLLLYKKTGVGLNSLMWEYLPGHWQMGPNIKTITFKELLTHYSGFRTSVRSYANLKDVVKAGINLDDKKGGSYNNTNYALLRLIIPKLAGYAIFSLKGKSASYIAEHEPAQAQAFANGYIDYCKKNLFDKTGSTFTTTCNQDSPVPPLFYSFGDQSLPGQHTGDQTLNAGSGGWVMSAAEMADFFRTLHFTEKMMPFELSKRLRDEHLGYGKEVVEGVASYFKSGSKPQAGCSYSSLIMIFDNGVQLAMMTNSDLSLKQLAWEAFADWYR
jgi:hypothetical protein